MATAQNLRNGVDVDRLNEAIEAVNADEANGELRFTVRSRWQGGFRGQHQTQEYRVGTDQGQRSAPHTISTDEPAEILGSDTGISPTETILSALASCLTVGYAANAAALGIQLEDLTLEVTGNGSLEGFMNLHGKRPGLSDISVVAHVRADASPEQLRELHEYVTSHSPMWDTIASPTRITSRVEVE
jgi:uncharacterized OsmC-like protein